MHQIKDAVRIFTLLAGSVALFTSCGSGDSKTPSVQVDNTTNLKQMALLQAEQQLGVQFNTIEREDTIDGKKIWVYTDEVPKDAIKTYLTINVENGDTVGWNAIKVYKDHMEKIGFSADLESATAGNPVLKRESIKLTDIELPENLNVVTTENLKSDKISPLSLCSTCVRMVEVPGHFQEETIWSYIVTFTAAGAAGGACGPNPAVAGACAGVGAWVSHVIVSWVPGYGYCAEWKGLGEVCPTAQFNFVDRWLLTALKMGKYEPVIG